MSMLPLRRWNARCGVKGDSDRADYAGGRQDRGGFGGVLSGSERLKDADRAPPGHHPVTLSNSYPLYSNQNRALLLFPVELTRSGLPRLVRPATTILMLCRPAIVVHELELATDYLSHVI
jgi:hypothetical protein